MMAGSNANATLVQDLTQVVRMNVAVFERNNSAALQRVTRPVNNNLVTVLVVQRPEGVVGQSDFMLTNVSIPKES